MYPRIIILKEKEITKKQNIKNLITDFYFLVENLMDLDLTNFERDRTDENLEGGMFEFDHRDFFIALNKKSLLKILSGEELKSELYWHWNGIDIRKLDKWIKKELTFCLISDTERTENLTEALPIGNRKDSDKVTIKISEDLIDKISKYKGGFGYEAYEYRYDTMGNKMHFYVNDSFGKEQLKDNIDFTKKVYNLTYPNNKE